MLKYLLIIFLSITSLFSQNRKPFLSNLNATKNSPLFSTYAAAMERSEFTLDEGYHFLFYDSTRGIDFTTDNAGDICLAFKKGAKYVYELKDMFKEPIITASYPDLVQYSYFPFEHIKVEVTFLTYSSHIAIQDVAIKNTGAQSVALEMFPFMRNSYRTFDSVVFHREKNAITFTHNEFPDDWTLEHNVLYIDQVRDVFLLSEPFDRLTSFRSYNWSNVIIPQQIDLKRKSVFILWRRVNHENNERCRHDLNKQKFVVTLNNDRTKILTENAPRWGSTDNNVNAYSLYGVELGNFGSITAADTFHLVFSCEESGTTATLDEAIGNFEKENNRRSDLRLIEQHLPKTPMGLKMDIWGSGTEIRLYWENNNEPVTYNVYRRDYKSRGVYELIAQGESRTFFTDKNISGDKVYGYIVVAVDSLGKMSMHSDEINNIAGSDFITDVKYPNQFGNPSLWEKNDAKDLVRVVAAAKKITIESGASKHVRIIRGVGRMNDSEKKLISDAQKLLDEDLSKYVKVNENLYSSIPVPSFNDADREMLYWNAFNLLRQVMLPPEGKCSYNYYVFSREPQWGWGHGGQVFHESLSMLAYAYMDAMSAMNSQRVYRERQQPDGYINYRTGSYLDETIPTNGQLTTSAPWYAWQNWEVYKITKDKKFLEEMYQSSKAFYNYYVTHRDSDNDGLCEWGAHGVLESVRDGRVAVWDEVGDPKNFDALDLNCMLVKEEKSLADMSAELGLIHESEKWRSIAEERAKRINQIMWDEETGFYYHVDKKNHSFTFKKQNDLKREEIIGFLPLWAGVADEQRAKRLVEKLLDTAKFWRKFGVPSLSADDSYYNPKGYWNGPVWVEWDYLIVNGLLQYGYKREAKELVMRVAQNMIAQLKKDHNFWEFYSPDDQWAGYHKTYIWAGIIVRMMMEVNF